jgi:hypothetical protein
LLRCSTADITDTDFHSTFQAHVRLARRVIAAVEKMMKEDTKNQTLIRQDTEKQAINGESLEKSAKQDRRTLVGVIKPFTRQGWVDTMQDPTFVPEYSTVWDVSSKR